MRFTPSRWTLSASDKARSIYLSRVLDKAIFILVGQRIGFLIAVTELQDI